MGVVAGAAFDALISSEKLGPIHGPLNITNIP